MLHPSWRILALVTITIISRSTGSAAGSDDSRRVIMNAMEILLHKQEKMDQSVDTMSDKIASLSTHVDGIAEKVKEKTDTGLLDTLTTLNEEMKSFSNDAKAVQEKITTYKGVLGPKLDTMKGMVKAARRLVSSLQQKATAPKVPQPAPPPTTAPTVKRNSYRRHGRPKHNRQKTSESRSDRKDRTSHVSHSPPKPKSKPVDEWEEFVKLHKDLLDKEDRKKAKDHHVPTMPSSRSSKFGSYPFRPLGRSLPLSSLSRREQEQMRSSQQLTHNPSGRPSSSHNTQSDYERMRSAQKSMNQLAGLRLSNHDPKYPGSPSRPSSRYPKRHGHHG